MKRLYIFLFFTQFSFWTFSQVQDSILIKQHFKSFKKFYRVENEKARKYIDSIEILLNEKPESKFNAQLYSIRGQLMESEGEYKKAIDFYEKAIKINSSINNLRDLIKNYSTLGIIYARIREDEKSKIYHKKAIKIAEQNNFSSLHIQSMMEYSSFYYQTSKLDSAIIVVMRALKLAETKGDNDILLMLNEHLGWYTLEIGSFNKSMKYFKKALKLSKINNLPIDIGSSHRNIASVFLYSNKKLDSAEYHYKEAIKIFEKIPEYDILSDCYYNIAQIEDSRSNYNKAIYYLTLAQEINERTGFKGMYYASKNLLAKQYLNLKQYKKSNKLFEEIIQDTINKNVPNDVLLSSLEYNAIAYEKGRNLENALKYLVLFTQYNAKFEKIEMNSRISDIETKYQTELKEKENLQLKAEKAEQELLTQKINTQRWYLFLFSIIAILSLIFYVKYSQNKRKLLLNNSRLEIMKAKLNKQEEIGIELHDGVAKNLESVSLKLDKEGINSIAREIKFIKEKIRKLSRGLSIISFEESSFEEQIVTLVSDYQNKNLKITINGLDSVNWNNIENPIKHYLLFIIREAVSNSYNYSKANNIFLEIKKLQKEIIVKVEDDGIGFDVNNVKLGNGIRNMKSNVLSINGKIMITSEINKGTQISISFDTI